MLCERPGPRANCLQSPHHPRLSSPETALGVERPTMQAVATSQGSRPGYARAFSSMRAPPPLKLGGVGALRHRSRPYIADLRRIAVCAQVRFRGGLPVAARPPPCVPPRCLPACMRPSAFAPAWLHPACTLWPMSRCRCRVLFAVSSAPDPPGAAGWGAPEAPPAACPPGDRGEQPQPRQLLASWP